MAQTETQVVKGIGSDYEVKYGFHVPEDYFFKSGRGLSHELVDAISSHKSEPDWMRKFRHKSLEYFNARPLPRWGGDVSTIDFDSIYYYIRPTEKQAKNWEDLPADILDTWDKLGIPEAEKKYLAGVGAQYESEVVYHKLKEDLEQQGVLFLDMDSGLREHEDLVKEYFGKIIPQNDNKFAALNSAVWSGGSFIYVPPGVRIEMPLQAYFRINAENMGQFERTLIIVDEGAYVHYVEGCTAPIYSTDSLHSAVVEIIVKKGGRCRYTTIQNWSTNVYNLVTKRAVAYEDATMEWVDGNLGSKLTMKYPAIWLLGEGAHGEVLSIAFAGKGQHQDAGGKCVHVAPHTSSVITSKSISKDGGRGGYRGLLEVGKGAVGSKSKVVCDALILDEDSRSDTYPYIRIDESDVDIGHEATVSKIGEEQLFYLMSRGPVRGRGERDDRLRLRRADHEGAAARVRGRDEPLDPAADGRVCWLKRLKAPLGNGIGASRVDFIAVPVQDRERAEKFYRETLGLEKNPLSTDSWVEFETGNVTLALVDPPTAGQSFVPLPFGSIVIRVPDVEAAKATSWKPGSRSSARRGTPASATAPSSRTPRETAWRSTAATRRTQTARSPDGRRARRLHPRPGDRHRRGEPFLRRGAGAEAEPELARRRLGRVRGGQRDARRDDAPHARLRVHAAAARDDRAPRSRSRGGERGARRRGLRAG